MHTLLSQDPACPTLDPSSPDTDSIPGGLESADLISFATQIASGMVSLQQALWYIHE